MDKNVISARDKMLDELVGLVKPKGTIKLPCLVVVKDPDIDPDYGSNEVHISSLVWEGTTDSVLCHGDFYDDGACIGEAEPIDFELLETDEMDMLLEQAKRA